VCPEPLVSVIIPTYNCSALLPDAIQSALAQTYSRLEVVVVDDGSTDNTQQVVASFGDSVRYVHRPNGGTAAARNTGIRNSRGELFALLDQDDRWLPQKLEHQVPLFDCAGLVGLVAGGGRVVSLATSRVTSEFEPSETIDVHELLAWCGIACASAVFSRDAIECVGLFDETLAGTDDWDMWIRIASAYKVVGCRHRDVEIREHGSNQGRKLDRMYAMAERVIRKHLLLHEDCQECVRSSYYASARLRLDYYVKSSHQARELWQAGRRVASIGAKAKAVWRYPRAIGQVPSRISSIMRGVK